MGNDRPFRSAENLDAMTPDKRLAAFRERIITNPDDLPAEFFERIYETGRRLARAPPCPGAALPGRRLARAPPCPRTTHPAVSSRRHVMVWQRRLLPDSFDRLDELLPPERTDDGTPSTADFVLHKLTSIV